MLAPGVAVKFVTSLAKVDPVVPSGVVVVVVGLRQYLKVLQHQIPHLHN